MSSPFDFRASSQYKTKMQHSTTQQQTDRNLWHTPNGCYMWVTSIIYTNQASLCSFFFKQKVHANPLGAFAATILGSDSSEGMNPVKHGL